MSNILPINRMSGQPRVYKPSNLRKSYNANDMQAYQNANQNANQILPMQYPPGLPVPMHLQQTQKTYDMEHSRQLKFNLMDILKNIVYRHMGIICGDFIVNEIHNRYITDEYYRQVANLYQANPTTKVMENLMKSFNNPEVLPELASRINKYSNTMNILIKQVNIAGFHNEIAILFSNQYSVHCSEYQYLSNIYPQLETECSNLVSYSLTFSNMYMPESIIVNIVVDIANSPNIIQLPYGIYDYREEYIISDGTQYHLPESILETFGNSTTKETAIQQTITNIQHQTYNVLPYCYNNDFFKEKMDKKFSEHKKIILDFITDITNNTTGDFYLTDWHNGFTCTECNIPIDKGERCTILKCCNLPYHTACLMNHYTLPEEGVSVSRGIKCGKCGVYKDDIAGKNCSILMGILG